MNYTRKALKDLVKVTKDLYYERKPRYLFEFAGKKLYCVGRDIFGRFILLDLNDDRFNYYFLWYDTYSGRGYLSKEYPDDETNEFYIERNILNFKNSDDDLLQNIMTNFDIWEMIKKHDDTK